MNSLSKASTVATVLTEMSASIKDICGLDSPFMLHIAPVVQLVEASDSKSECCRFESD